jgi:hypothetical protein
VERKMETLAKRSARGRLLAAWAIMSKVKCEMELTAGSTCCNASVIARPGLATRSTHVEELGSGLSKVWCDELVHLLDV